MNFGTIFWLQLLSSISAVNAANPQFQKAAAQLSGADLLVTWSEVGLGDNENINYLIEATASATYACFNKGNKNPQATNKRDFTEPISQPATFNSGKNGRINGNVLIAPVSPSSDFSCPAGQVIRLAFVSYTDVKVTDTTNNIDQAIPGTFEHTFIVLKK